MNPEVNAVSGAAKTAVSPDLKAMEAALQEMQAAFDAKDDVKTTEALKKLDALIKTALGETEKADQAAKPDPFAEKVAKYAPQAK